MLLNSSLIIDQLDPFHCPGKVSRIGSLDLVGFFDQLISI